MDKNEGCQNWIGDRFFNGDRESETVSMKPLLGKLIDEAFRIAVIDSIGHDIDDERRVEVYRDIYKITEEEWQSIDPGALAKNVANRLLSSGGWSVRGVYAGNASARDIFEATVGNSDENQTDRFIADLRASGADVVEGTDG